MRKWTMSVVVVMASVILASVAAAAEVSREDFEDLQKHVREQAKEIVQLRGRIAMLEKRVEELKSAKNDESTDEEATEKEKEKEEKEKVETDNQLQKIGAPLSQWQSEHYVDYDWIERKGWNVPMGRRNGSLVLEGHDNARRSRLIYQRPLKGDWAARMQIGGVEGVWVELVQNRQKKLGYEVRLPDRRHVRLDVKREDGKVTATINGNTNATITEKRYGADPKGEMHLAIVVKSGKKAYVRNVDVYVERGSE